MKKNLLLCFLLMAFCLQNLPLQLLQQDSKEQQYANQVPMDEDEEGIKEKDSIKYCLVSHLFELIPSSEQRQLGIQVIAHSIPQNYSVEIHVPPPNC